MTNTKKTTSTLLYSPMIMQKKALVSVYGQMEQELDLIWIDGQVGAIPLFGDAESAKKAFPGIPIKILDIE